MKKTLLLLVALIITTIAFAQTEIDGIYYNFDNSTQTAEVTFGYIWDTNEYYGNISIPEKVTYNSTEYSVTSIGFRAFYGCSSLTSISIPNSVTSIGDYAFYNCTSLTSITIPNSVTSIGEYTFYNCTSLTSIAIPNSVTEIGGYAFKSCHSLTSITIPNSVTSIGEGAFDYCSSLTSITIPNSVTSIGNGAFSSCSSLTSITIPNSVTSIGNNAFSNCASLTSITIPNSVTSIGNNAFSSCSCLSFITMEATTPPTLGSDAFYQGIAIYIPDNTLSAYKSAWGTDYVYLNNETTLTVNVETPGTLYDLIFDAGQRPAFVTKLTVTGTLNDDDFTCMRKTMTSLVDVDLFGITNTNGVNFYEKNNLVKIILPNNLAYIGELTFFNCSSLSSITMSNSVISIGNYAFKYCSSLTSITIPNSVTSIGEEAFCNSSLTSITIPNSVTSIGKDAFSCSSLTSVTIPNSVTFISSGAFYSCTSLTSITIPNSVTSIGREAFLFCSSLTSITIPNSVTSIGEDAFYNCSELDTITCLGSTPPAATDLGANTQTCVLIVPNEAYQNYMRHTYWGQFFTIHTIGDKEIKALANNYTWGKVSGGGVFNENETATLTATANEGYRFVKWDDEVTDNPRTVIVTQDSTFTAIFVPIFTITTAVNNEDMGSVTEGGEYISETIITLTATPNEGYHFVKWSDGNTDNPRTIIVTQNLSLSAEFAINTYIVNVSTENGTTFGSGEYTYGTKTTIAVIANKGYEFSNWSDGNTENPRNITITENVNLKAILQIETHNNFIVESSDETQGSVIITITAQSIEGFEFSHWSDDNTENPRVVTLDKNVELYAYFRVAGTGLENSVISSANIYTNNGILHVEGAETDYYILDAAGRLIYTGNATTLSLPRGIYLITIRGEIQKIVL